MAEDIQRITGTDAKIAARLCNFVTGKDFLLAKHLVFLETEVAPVLRSMHGPWVDIHGYASRKGDANFNMALSKRRINSVRLHLSRHTNSANFKIYEGYGETQSGPNENDNDGYWRAVEVYVFAEKPQPKPAPTVVESTLFEIRVVDGVSVNVGPVQLDGYFFQIVDIRQRLTADYLYTAMGLPFADLSKLIKSPGSTTKTGPPEPFRTTRHTDLHQFHSRKAELLMSPGVAIGSWSAGGTMRLAIQDLQDLSGHISTIPSLIPIKGGWGIQMPGTGSASRGMLTMRGEILPFNGY
jgi:hypothetical protein